MNEKNIVFLLFVSIPSIADELIYSNYFRDFTEAFTPPIISVNDYSKLSSYKLHPELFVDFGKSPPESFDNNDLHNSNVIFNGAAFKKLFINFVNSTFLNGDVLNGNKKTLLTKMGVILFG
ncbi:hypothetical protein ACVEU2_004631 [Enterobacter hormaechei]